MDRSATSQSIRICLAVPRGLGRELLRDAFAPYRDIEVVDLGDGSVVVGEDCDVLVTLANSQRGGANGWLQPVLDGRRENILVLTIDEALIMIFEFRSRQRLMDPSPDALVSAVREAVAAAARKD